MKKKDWYKTRGYIHLSNKIPASGKNNVRNYIQKRENISSHSFMPFLYKKLVTRRYKKNVINNGAFRSHKSIDPNGFVSSNQKVREIFYASHLDSHIYSYYSNVIIGEKYETYLKKNPELNNCITAYRRIESDCGNFFKNNIHFANEIFIEIKKRKECVAIAFDIENFFPSLSHKILKKQWANILEKKSLPKDHYNIYKSITNFSYVRLNDFKTKNGHFNEKRLSQLRHTGKYSLIENIKELVNSDIVIRKNQKKINNKIAGIPQGLPISALLANLYMLPFDEAITNQLVKPLDVFYRRYSDDIMIICSKDQETEVVSFILNQIQKIELKISEEKTEKVYFSPGSSNKKTLSYLGFEFDGKRIFLKSKNLAGFYREMKDSIQTRKKRIETKKLNGFEDQNAIYKRKIYRLYSYKGVKSRQLPTTRIITETNKQVQKKTYRKFRGNYIKYAYRASEEMGAPEIKHQVRNHWKILQETLKKYKFSNVR